jgi:phenylacetate-CoA ligase
VVSRAGEVDVMTLKAETTGSDDGLREAVSATLRSVTKLGGIADLVVPGLLPNDGRIIADERGH